MGLFTQKSHIINGSLAERDLHLQSNLLGFQKSFDGSPAKCTVQKDRAEG